jgi:hypothetical protein
MYADEIGRRILAAYEAGSLVTMCAWCRRVKIDGRWLAAPRAALSAIDAQYALSHSICPGCAVASQRTRVPGSPDGRPARLLT